MADEEHLALLQQSVDAWNAWRDSNVEIRPDLSQADLSQAHLGEADLRGAYLYEADLRRADLCEANLSWADLEKALLNGADLCGADLSGVNLRGADLIGADLSKADLTEGSLRGANFHGANLIGADLSEAELMGANLIGADLSEAELIGTNLIGADLSGANLRSMHIGGSNFRGANLSEADLYRTNFYGTNLSEVNFSRANFSETNLDGVNLSKGNFSRAIVRNTTFSDVDLSTMVGLETAIHQGPSTIGIDTLYRSGGKIPLAFLRGCGVPDSFIEYIPALIGTMQPIQYYSCFIGYSMADDAFARRLHERMRAEHLRVWFAPEDIKGGEKLYEQIDRAIQLHDRLLLVLSEASIQSPWVTTEIRRARAAEQKEQRRKLFPIRLTDFDTLRDWTCFDSDTGTDLASEVRSYYVPDFSHWKDHDAFEAAFAGLLRDLRAAERPRPPLQAEH